VDRPERGERRHRLAADRTVGDISGQCRVTLFRPSSLRYSVGGPLGSNAVLPRHLDQRLAVVALGRLLDQRREVRFERPEIDGGRVDGGGSGQLVESVATVDEVVALEERQHEGGVDGGDLGVGARRFEPRAGAVLGGPVGDGGGESGGEKVDQLRRGGQI